MAATIPATCQAVALAKVDVENEYRTCGFDWQSAGTRTIIRFGEWMEEMKWRPDIKQIESHVSKIDSASNPRFLGEIKDDENLPKILYVKDLRRSDLFRDRDIFLGANFDSSDFFSRIKN
ncbi:MAG TPA: hypothetical protein VF988_05260 [Verrucomicrobiae bacterium]